MKFYTDGSRIKAFGATKESYLKGIGVVIGWGSVSLDYGKISSGAHLGGSNINAEMFSIRDLVEKLENDHSMLDEKNDKDIEIVTDSKTSIQINNICLKLSKDEYMEGKNFEDLKMNEQSALRTKNAIVKLEHQGFNIFFKHVRGHGKDPEMDLDDIEGNKMADAVATEASGNLNNLYINGDKNFEEDEKWYEENRRRLGFIK